jgi:hypothetical protein
MDDLNANKPRAGLSPEIAAMSTGERFQLMFDMPNETPPWKQQAESLGIETECIEEDAKWTASIEWWGDSEAESAETEKMAVEALIFRLELK